MSIERFFIHELVITRAAAIAGRGADVVKDWSAATTHDATGWVAQLSTDDVRDTRSGDESTHSLQTAATTDVRPGDRVVWKSMTFDVVGRPNNAYTPRGEHHIEARLRIVEG